MMNFGIPMYDTLRCINFDRGTTPKEYGVYIGKKKRGNNKKGRKKK